MSLSTRSINNKQVNQALWGQDTPLGFQEFEALRFPDNQQMKVVRLSALRTSQLYTPENIAGTYFR
jgi:hypothetical protein